MKNHCFYCAHPPVAYDLCRFHYDRVLDPHWQLATPYRDEQYRQTELKRSYTHRDRFRHSLKRFYANQLLDFGLRKDGVQMILDLSEMDKKLVRFLKMMLDFMEGSRETLYLEGH